MTFQGDGGQMLKALMVEGEDATGENVFKLEGRQDFVGAWRQQSTPKRSQISQMKAAGCLFTEALSLGLQYII